MSKQKRRNRTAAFRFHTLYCIAAAGLAAAAVLPLAAQETSGTILGVVTDSSGADIPGATVTIKNTDRNAVERTLKTNGTGEYAAPQLPIGHYVITVTAPHFKSSDITNLTLNVNDKLRVKATLQVGNVNESVSVQANALQVNTQSATAETLITGTQIRELALATRNFEQLTQLMPGVTSDVSDQLYAGASQPGGATNETAISLNGSFGTGNNWTIDGADDVDRGNNAVLLDYPSVDAIDEFKVLRGNYNAEYGRASGGQVNVVTRSGESKFHGDLYEFFRNNVLDANSFSNKLADPIVPRTPFRYNDFGGTFGGPVFIPHIYNEQRNKTFFFFSEEQRRIVEYDPTTAVVPNLAERGANGVPTFAYPVCLVPTSGDGTCPAGESSTTIPLTSISPAANAYLKDVYAGVPAPQDASLDLLQTNQRSVYNFRQEIYRLDHTFDPKWSMFLRYLQDSIPTVEGGGLFTGNTVPDVGRTSTQSPGKNAVAAINTIFSPTLLNQLEYAWSFGAILSTPTGQLATANSPDVVSAITLPNPETVGRVPSISFGTGGAGFAGYGVYRDFNKNHNVFDNLTKIVGNHTLKFGFTYYHYQKSENSGGNNSGTFSFQVSPDTTLSGGADPNAEFHQEFADFLLGDSTSFVQANSDIRATINQNQLEFYGQDEWRALPNLTLSYGLRYSLFRQPTDAQGIATSFDPNAFNPNDAPVIDNGGLLCTPSTQPCSGTAATNPAYNPLNGIINGGINSPYGTKVAREAYDGFAPRLGFAWDPGGQGKMSVRGGYGLFVEAIGVGNVENSLFANPPYVGTTTIYNAPLDNPAAVQAAPNSSPNPIQGTAPNYSSPYQQQFNLDVQRELPGDIIADIGYYGSKGTHLQAIEDINQPDPGAYATNAQIQSIGAALCGSATNPLCYQAGTQINGGTESILNLIRPYKGYAGIDEYESSFSSNYNSLQASLQKHFNATSLVTINYTYSKNLTNVPNDPNYTIPQDSHNLTAEYSHSRFDQRHVFNASFVYDIPGFDKQEGLKGHTLGGWEVSGIVTASSGHWLSPGISDGQDPGGLGLGTGTTGNIVFPDVVGNPNRGAPHTAAEWFNTAAFTASPADQTIAGTAKKNSILGPGQQNWDLSLMKNIRAVGDSSFQFRLESFNTFNHTNPSGIDTTVNDSTYGQVLSAHDARIVQLALKYKF
jgi:hypothetical protein